MNLNFKLIILIWIIFDFDFMSEMERYQSYYQRDLFFCATCFRRSEKQCQRFFQKLEVEPDTTPLQRFVSIWSKRDKQETRLLQLKHTKTKVMAKAVASRRQFEILAETELSRPVLAQIFFDSVRLDYLQYCPATSTTRFVEYLEFQNNSDELTSWLYMLVNVQPILLPYLHELGFPVPKTLATCGFTIFQEYAGTTMTQYYNASFGIKLRIAKQLLQGVLKFSGGFNRFRLYITDLTSDNVVYNEERDKLYFVDLDSLLIVDADAVVRRTERGSIHKYEYIRCDNCFAYVQQDICEYENSDFVLFQACQLLREDLNRNPEKGFLYPVPADIKKIYIEFDFLLDMCVDCYGSACQHRFASTVDLIHLFENIIYEMKL